MSILVQKRPTHIQSFTALLFVRFRVDILFTKLKTVVSGEKQETAEQADSDLSH